MENNQFTVKIPGGCPSLVRLCTLSITSHLSKGTWRSLSWYFNPHEHNPFRYFPPYIVEDIVSSVYPKSSVERHLIPRKHGVPLYEMLCPLLLSNRVENFELYINNDNLSEVSTIIKLLCYKADRLKSLNISFSGSRTNQYHRNSLNDSIMMLVSTCENLQSLCTEVYFDLRILQTLKKLQSMKFKVSSKIPEIIVPDEYFMRCLGILYMNDMSLEFGNMTVNGIALLLTSLPQLQFVQWDISEPLLEIHGKEEVAQITKRYELRIAYLGACNKTEIQVFVQTCPQITRLKLIYIHMISMIYMDLSLKWTVLSTYRFNLGIVLRCMKMLYLQEWMNMTMNAIVVPAFMHEVPCFKSSEDKM